MALLREVRERKLVTQQELAARAGLSKTTIVNLEMGKAPPIISTRRKIAHALGVSADEIDWPKTHRAKAQPRAEEGRNDGH